MSPEPGAPLQILASSFRFQNSACQLHLRGLREPLHLASTLTPTLLLACYPLALALVCATGTTPSHS